VVSATDPHGRNLGFLDPACYYYNYNITIKNGENIYFDTRKFYLVISSVRLDDECGTLPSCRWLYSNLLAET
jgi:hypothetical protein